MGNKKRGIFTFICSRGLQLPLVQISNPTTKRDPLLILAL